jgi:hypothetical protein
MSPNPTPAEAGQAFPHGGRIEGRSVPPPGGIKRGVKNKNRRR